MWILALLPNIIRWFAIGAVVASVAGFFWSWDARGKKVERQKQEIVALKHNIRVAKDNLELREGEIDALARRSIQEDKDLTRLCEVLWRSEVGKDEVSIDEVLEGIRRIEELENNDEVK